MNRIVLKHLQTLVNGRAASTVCRSQHRCHSDLSVLLPRPRPISHGPNPRNCQPLSSSVACNKSTISSVQLRYKHVEAKDSTAKEPVETGDKSAPSDRAHTTDMRSKAPTDFERRIFVWTGRYQTVDEVPAFVTDSAINSAKSKLRIYINIAMCATTFIAALVVMYVGRGKARRGESIAQRNMERHPEKYQQRLEAHK